MFHSYRLLLERFYFVARFENHSFRKESSEKGAVDNSRVKEWRVTLGVPLSVSTVSSFVPV